MIREFFSIGSEVYFINDDQKIGCGYITEICYSAKKESSYDGWSNPVRETVHYVIDGKFRRKGEFVFRSRKELIDSL